MTKCMVKVQRNGIMDVNMLEIGKKGSIMAKVHLLMLVEGQKKAFSKMISTWEKPTKSSKEATTFNEFNSKSNSKCYNLPTTKENGTNYHDVKDTYVPVNASTLQSIYIFKIHPM